MTDKEFLNWIADRLVHVYGESPNTDFIHKLRELAQPAPFPFEQLEEELTKIAELQDRIRLLEKQLSAQTELCKYGQEPKLCTSSPMDCQCALDATFAQPEQEPVAIRYDFDGYGWKYVDSGFGSNWQEWIRKLHKDVEPLYTTPPPVPEAHKRKPPTASRSKT